MSKDLKKEYDEMIRSDVPDLWGRISENLPEKKVKRNRTKIYWFAAAAAACVCIAAAIPAVINMSLQKQAGSVSQTAMAEPAETEAKEETPEYIMHEDNAAAAPAKASEAAAEEPAAHMENAATAEEPEAYMEAEAAEAGENESSKAEAPNAEKKASDANHEAEIYAVTAVILEKQTAEDGNTVYTAEVTAGDASGKGPEAGTTVRIETDEETPAASAESLAGSEQADVLLEASGKDDVWLLR